MGDILLESDQFVEKIEKRTRFKLKFVGGRLGLAMKFERNRDNG